LVGWLVGWLVVLATHYCIIFHLWEK